MTKSPLNQNSVLNSIQGNILQSKILHLRVADELPVQFCIKRLHMSTVHIQDRVADNTDLRHEEENTINKVKMQYNALQYQYTKHHILINK